MAQTCCQQLGLGQKMELGLQEDEANILVEYSKLLHSSQGSLSLTLAFASHHEAQSFLPIQTNLHST